MMSAQGLLIAFRVSVEKSDVILVILHLYVTWAFPPYHFYYSFFVLCI
jgi:hypothetical protein